MASLFNPLFLTHFENKADYLVSIDADGQFDSVQIVELLRPIINNEAEFVTGIRFTQGKPENMSLVKFYGNILVNKIISISSGNSIKDASCGFRAYSRESLLKMNLIGVFTYTHETILDLCHKGLQFKQIPVNVKYFPERKSRVAGSIVPLWISISKNYPSFVTRL